MGIAFVFLKQARFNTQSSELPKAALWNSSTVAPPLLHAVIEPNHGSGASVQPWQPMCGMRGSWAERELAPSFEPTAPNTEVERCAAIAQAKAKADRAHLPSAAVATNGLKLPAERLVIAVGAI